MMILEVIAYISFSAKGNIEVFANNTDSGESARNELSHLKSARNELSHLKSALFAF